MRVVLDTNLLISALIPARGFPARLLDAWDEQRFELVSSKEQLDKIRAVSHRSRLAPYIERHDVGRFINQLHAEALLIARWRALIAPQIPPTIVFWRWPRRVRPTISSPATSAASWH